MSCAEVNFVWINTLTVKEKDCDFVEMLRVIMCVCMFEIIVLEKYCD